MANVVSFKHYQAARTQGALTESFEQDLLALFTFQRQGHMEKWAYADAAYPNDPAGGAQFWEKMVLHPRYYLAQADMAMIDRALQHSGVDMILRHIETVVELGPGSIESIQRKTLPFLRYAKEYVAIDANLSHAQQATYLVHQKLGIPVQAHSGDYFEQMPQHSSGKTGFVMWGSSLGNLEGNAGEKVQPRLVKSLAILAQECRTGDSLFISIDTETRPEVLSQAYNMPLASRKMLSVLYDAHRQGLMNGAFDPDDWTHRSVWHPETGQCAHYLISGQAQDFTIAGKRVLIPAGKAFNIINSYKFEPTDISIAAKTAGFSRVLITDDRPMALLIATK